MRKEPKDRYHCFLYEDIVGKMRMAQVVLISLFVLELFTFFSAQGQLTFCFEGLFNILPFFPTHLHHRANSPPLAGACGLFSRGGEHFPFKNVCITKYFLLKNVCMRKYFLFKNVCSRKYFPFKNVCSRK